MPCCNGFSSTRFPEILQKKCLCAHRTRFTRDTTSLACHTSHVTHVHKPHPLCHQTTHIVLSVTFLSAPVLSFFLFFCFGFPHYFLLLLLCEYECFLYTVLFFWLCFFFGVQNVVCSWCCLVAAHSHSPFSLTIVWLRLFSILVCFNLSGCPRPF